MTLIVRIIVLAILFFLIFWLISGFVSPKSSGRSRIREEELVKDSLTGVYFLKSKAIIVNKDGQKLYFSSVDNRDRWLRQDGDRP